MFNKNSDTKVYVHCPSGVVTGGAELLHQVVSILNHNGVNAYIVYFGANSPTIPNDYKDYYIKIASSVEDKPYNIEIIYEGIFSFIYNTNNTQKFLWWLSVDNFFLCSSAFLSFRDMMQYNRKLAVKNFLSRTYRVITVKPVNKKISLKMLKGEKYIHGYQSEYAQFFLLKNGFSRILPLKDFINTDYNAINNKAIMESKEDLILYNPKKGLEYTKKLINLAPDLEWIPIQNLTRKELIELMKKAKLYVDFGYHPGKDRLPRESAMSGCCIITGRRGSAYFFEDVSIPNKYKFDEKKTKKSDVIDIIKWTLANYKTAINDFKFYRQQINLEKDEFERQVLNIFN